MDITKLSNDFLINSLIFLVSMFGCSVLFFISMCVSSTLVCQIEQIFIISLKAKGKIWPEWHCYCSDSHKESLRRRIYVKKSLFH